MYVSGLRSIGAIAVSLSLRTEHSLSPPSLLRPRALFLLPGMLPPQLVDLRQSAYTYVLRTYYENRQGETAHLENESSRNTSFLDQR